jgi:hypothetical protein
MQLPTPQVYTLQLGERAAYQVWLSRGDRKGFRKPATLRCPKLYVVTRQKKIHYVGVTNQPMSARIKFGLKAEGEEGYHGYKWKSIRDRLRLLVWSFATESGKPFLRELETVEAELAFLVRKVTGRWPLSQIEIHFYQATPAHIKAVSAIFALINTRGQSRIF